MEDAQIIVIIQAFTFESKTFIDEENSNINIWFDVKNNFIFISSHIESDTNVEVSERKLKLKRVSQRNICVVFYGSPGY